MKPMDCDITGVKNLRLAVAGAPTISGAWGTWGGAVISKSGEITDGMLYSEYTFEPMPPEDDTEESTSPEVDTETVTPSETNTETITVPPDEIPTEAATPPEAEDLSEDGTTESTSVANTQAPAESGGCGSMLSASLLLMLLGGAAVCIQNRKREERNV